MRDPHMTATLERKGKTIKVSIRQMPHDVPLVVGRKYKYDTGPMYLVLAIEPCREF